MIAIIKNATLQIRKIPPSLSEFLAAVAIHPELNVNLTIIKKKKIFLKEILYFPISLFILDILLLQKASPLSKREK